MARDRRVRTGASVAAVALLIAACGGDDDAGGSTEEFCDLVAEPMSGDATDDEIAEEMASLEAAAPAEIAEQVEALADLFASLREIDLENASDDDLAALDATLTDFQRLSAELEAWTLDNCPDVDEGTFSPTG